MKCNEKYCSPIRFKNKKFVLSFSTHAYLRIGNQRERWKKVYLKTKGNRQKNTLKEILWILLFQLFLFFGGMMMLLLQITQNLKMKPSFFLLSGEAPSSSAAPLFPSHCELRAKQLPYFPLITITSSSVNGLSHTKHLSDGISFKTLKACTQPQVRR